ncbi:hypothetical protein BH23BAC1_BH23BAC1_36950 [soil metagenome]
MEFLNYSQKKVKEILKKTFTCSWIIFIFFALASCDDCPQCGPMDTEPSVRIKLINADSIRLVSSIIADHQAAIEYLSQEVELIEVRLEDETLEEQERVGLEAQRDVYIAEIQAINEVIAAINPILVNLRNGRIRIDTLYSPGGLREISFRRDTAFSIPLRPDADFSTLIFIFNHRRDTLTLHYQRKDTLMNDRLRIFSNSLSLGEHTFNDTSRVINDRRVEVYY